MGLQADLEAAKAEVVKIEAEIAALPAYIIGKTEQELADLYHAITAYFNGSVPAPTLVAEDLKDPA